MDHMQRYVDGFLIPIPKENLARYKEIAAKAGEVWMEHGAIEYYECAGDDLNKEGMISFIQSAGASESETVIFSWIVYESKEERDRINALVMADPRMNDMMGPGPEPFDFRRIAYGGFRPLVIA